MRPMTPTYFGSRSAHLFGCWHFPESSSERDFGILICQALGDEYLLSHRGMRQLATRLSGAGFPVLRFDYYGCGDSAGDESDVSVSYCVESVATAVSELRNRSGCSRIGAVGLRLGASFSYLAGAHSVDFDAVALWEPIISGDRYLEDRDAANLQKVEALGIDPDTEAGERLGYPMSTSILQELREVNLLEIAQRPARNVLILAHGDDEPARELTRKLNTVGVPCRRDTIDGPHFWQQDAERVIVPANALGLLVSWFSELTV